MHDEREEIFAKGVDALDEGNTLSALYYFEKALSIEQSPAITTYFALCIAKERGQVNKAISFCKEAIEKEPENPVLYLNLGRIYLFSNKKNEAIEIFREGLRQGTNPQIVEELNRLGTRKPPVLPFLKRSNPLNKYLGIILKKLKIR